MNPLSIHSSKWLMYTILATSLTIGACGQQNEGNQKGAANNPAQQMPPPQVGIIVAQPQAIENVVKLTGRTAAYQISEVRPQASGVILKRLFNEGSDVHEGQPLYELDDRTNQALLQTSQATLLRQQATLKSLEVKAGRYQQLVGSNAISKQDYDDILAQVELAKADVKAAQANVDNAKINLQYSTIRAPISGQTGQSSVTVGALVNANQAQSLVTIQQLDPIYVNINQSSTELLKLRQQLKQGQLDPSHDTNVRLRLEEGSIYPIEGKLAFSTASVDPTTGSITLRAVFKNPHHLLLPGMFVNAEIVQGRIPNAYLIPQVALTRTPTGDAMLMLVNAQGQVETRPVQTAGVQGQNWIVTQGLKEGDKVIVDGIAKVKEAMPVQASLFNPEATSPSAQPKNQTAAQAIPQTKNPSAKQGE